MMDRESTRLFRGGSFDAAAESLKKGLAEQGDSGKDQLLYLLDLGLVLHTAGRYEESNKALLQADKVAEIKDYTSLSTEAATLLTGDNIKDYKGEDFENVLISTYLAMNFALMGDHENALVEARRVNRKLYMMITEGKRKYKQNAFARYLSGVLYEAGRDFNDAYIDYKAAYELDSGIRDIGLDLWRTARLSGLRQDADKWVESFQLTDDDRKRAMATAPKSGKGELIVLYENGISPVKGPHPDFHSIPRFYPRMNPVRSARVLVDAAEAGETAVLHDIEATAISNLEEKYGGIIARKIAGIAAKEIVAAKVGESTNSPLLRQLTRLIFYASDQADIRSWNLLPRDLQILRVPVDPGTHTVRLLPAGAAGEPSLEKTVQVSRGGKVFVNFRYMP